MSRKRSRNNVSERVSEEAAASAGRPAGDGAYRSGVRRGQSVPFPTYVTGPQPNGSWVVSDGQIITPAGTQVDLGIRVRAKAIALNPNSAATPPPSSPWARRRPSRCSTPTPAKSCRTISRSGQDSSGSYSGITYSADGKYLMFSQDSSNVTIANVSAAGPAGRLRPGHGAAEQQFHHVLSE